MAALEFEIATEWARLDEAALHVHSDKSLARECGALRSLVVREALASPQKDLPQALGHFGHFLGAHGASPTFVATTVESLETSWCATSRDPSWLPQAHAAIFESYVLARIAEERDAAAKAWAPECTVVLLDATTAAIAAAPPFDDGEKISVWADRVASYLSRRGVRTAVAGGHPRALIALESACGVAGVSFRAAATPTK